MSLLSVYSLFHMPVYSLQKNILPVLQVWHGNSKNQRPYMKLKRNGDEAGAKAFSPAALSGSLTLEAAVICPMLIGVFVIFLNFFIFLYQESVMNEHLENIARIYAHSEDEIRSAYDLQWRMEQEIPSGLGKEPWYFGESDLEAEDGTMDLIVYNQIRFTGLPLGKTRYYMADRVKIHIWTGMDMAQEEETVYITLKGTVYHRDRNCTYLRPSVTKINAGDVKDARNKNGEKYTACKECSGAPALLYGYVYITDYGVLYHRSENCGYINHSVLEVKISDVSDRRGCSKCSKP